jgi:hypothetical protein
MSKPIFVDCPVDTWTKIATAVTTGQIWRAQSIAGYLQTYVPTGDTAPSDRGEGAKLFADGDNEKIDSSDPIDAYVFATGTAGRVRVDI